MKRAAAVACLLLVPQTAWAYCRTSACTDKVVGAECLPAKSTDCGTPLFWPESCIGFSIQKDGTARVTADETEAVVTKAFASWMAADCGGGTHPRIEVSDLGKVTCNQIEYNQDGANNNAIIYRNDAWPYPATNALALTTVTYNLDTGEIRDADTELNAFDVEFSTSDTDVTFDLQSILTHEMGHFLGLAHSPEPGATMEPDYPPKSTDLRTLSDDDVAAICAAYPPGVITTCDPTPHGGLGDACMSPAVASTADSGCCAVAAGSDASSDAGGFAALVGLAAAIVRSRRTKRWAPSS